MKFIANNRLNYIAFAALGLLLTKSAIAESCQCANPPGGEVKCPKGYAAYCFVHDGKANTGCEEAPNGLSAYQLGKWILEKALAKAGVEKGARDITSIHVDEATGTGSITTAAAGYKLTFTLPKRGD